MRSYFLPFLNIVNSQLSSVKAWLMSSGIWECRRGILHTHAHACVRSLAVSSSASDADVGPAAVAGLEVCQDPV